MYLGNLRLVTMFQKKVFIVCATSLFSETISLVLLMRFVF